MKKLFIFVITLFFCMNLFSQASNVVFQKSFESREVWNIKADLSFESIQIEQIYGTEILVEISSNNLNKIPSVCVEEHTLAIEGLFKRYSSGDKCTVYIYVPQEYTADKISVLNETGDITCENLLIKEDLTLITKSGNISVDYANCDFVKLNATSGNISASQLQCEFFRVFSISGDITLKIDKAPVAKSFVRSESSDISVFVPGNADFELIADCPEGKLKDKFNDESVKAGRDYHKTFRNGGAELLLQTKSGNIILDEYK